MVERQNISNLVQCHNSIEQFDYDITVDWAIDLIREGKETENILMLASFTKPVDSREIRNYVSAVLTDLNLEEKQVDAAMLGKIHFELVEILNSCSARKNLESLYKSCLEHDHKYGLSTFYMLYYAWLDLDEFGYQLYYEGATLENIESILKKEAQNWIEEFI